MINPKKRNLYGPDKEVGFGRFRVHYLDGWVPDSMAGLKA